MPGPLRTFSNAFVPDTSANFCREIHAGLNTYFERHPGFTRIASNYGTSGTGLSGSYAFVSQSGENAWSIFRAVSSSIPYDIALVWSYSANYITNTWTSASPFGIGLALAYHPSGAWSGSVGNNGTDTFFSASTPWRSGSIVCPRPNAVGGTTPITKNSVLKVAPSAIGTNLIQFYVVGDNETTYTWIQNAEASIIGDVTSFCAFGTYTPFTSSYNLPLFGFSTTNMTPSVLIGNLTASEPGSTNNSGGVTYDTTSDFRSFYINFPLNAPKKAPRPAPELGGTSNSKAFAFPVSINGFEAGHHHQLGILSGVYVVAGNAFGNIQDVSRSFVSIKPALTQNFSFLLPYSGSTDFFLKGTFE